MFPVEIWEKIFQQLDAVDLVRLATVNSNWNAIITRHLEQSDAWYRQCEKDIPKKYWFMLLENSFHSLSLKQQLDNDNKYNHFDISLWLTLYKAWLKWKNVHNYNLQVTEEFSPIPKHRPTERITCCSVLGELVALGSSEGYIRIFNLRTNKLVFQVDQYEHVESIKLWVLGKKYEKIILIATSFYKTVTIWDIISQKIIISKRSGFVICAGYSYYCIGLKGKTIIARDITSQKNFSVRLLINDNERIGSNMYPVNMTINMQKLCCLYHTGLYCEIDLTEVSEINALYEPIITNLGAPKSQRILQYYLFNPHVVFCTTDRGYLGLSVYKSKWEMFNVFPVLEGLVTTIHFYVRVLILGLDTGDICLYSVKDVSSLRTVDLKKPKRIHVASDPIVSVNIMEISGDQRLLVTTKDTVYNIKLTYT